MGLKNVSNKLANSAKDFNEMKKADAAAKIIAREEALAVENVRQEQLVKGVFEPVPMTINLDEHESAYAVFNASRYALVDKVTETTTGRTKKKGIVGRAVVGGVLLGPVGALGGAATAGSKTHSTTTLNTSKVSDAIDHGQLILTNNRLLFMGNNGILSLPYTEILAHDFYQRSTAITNLKLKFLEMLPGEYFALSGPAVKDANLDFSGNYVQVL